MDGAQLVGLILGTAAVVAGINAIWHMAIKPGFSTFMKNRERVKLVDQVPEISQKVDTIQETLQRLEPLIVQSHHELHPNSGQSLKDQATRTEEAVEEIRLAVMDHLTDPDAHN